MGLREQQTAGKDHPWDEELANCGRGQKTSSSFRTNSTGPKETQQIRIRPPARLMSGAALLVEELNGPAGFLGLYLISMCSPHGSPHRPRSSLLETSRGTSVHMLNKNINATLVFAPIFHDLNLKIENIFFTQRAKWEQKQKYCICIFVECACEPLIYWSPDDLLGSWIIPEDHL